MTPAECSCPPVLHQVDRFERADFPLAREVANESSVQMSSRSSFHEWVARPGLPLPRRVTGCDAVLVLPQQDGFLLVWDGLSTPALLTGEAGGLSGPEAPQVRYPNICSRLPIQRRSESVSRSAGIRPVKFRRGVSVSGELYA